MKLCRFFKRQIALAAALFLLVPAAFASGYTAETIDSVAVYTEPGRILEWLPAGIRVTVDATSNGWAKVSYAGVAGFMEQSKLTYPHPLAGFASIDTDIYAAPNEFSSHIVIPRGFPLTILGEIGQFYLVENAYGQRGYAIRTALSPTAPGGVNPFSVYDPRWEQASCMLLLPAWTTLYESLQPGAHSMQIPQAMPCHVLGRSGNYYFVTNVDRSAAAWIHLADLLPMMLV